MNNITRRQTAWALLALLVLIPLGGGLGIAASYHGWLTVALHSGIALGIVTWTIGLVWTLVELGDI